MSDERERPDDDGDSDGGHEEGERRHLFERAVPEVIRRLLERAVESGVEKLSEAPENVRNLLDDLKLPKEALHYLYGQIDDTKKGLYRVVAKEIRDVLEHTNFAAEIADVLTKLSFEINTQIRFVPNPQAAKPPADPPAEEEEDGADAGEGSASGLPRPRVVSKMVLKARDRLERRTKDKE